MRGSTCLWAVLAVVLLGCAQARSAATSNSVSTMSETSVAKPDSSHKTADGFVNPLGVSDHGSLFGFLKARFRSGKWASYQPERYRVPTTQPEFADQDDEPVVTWIGHSTVLLQHRGLNVITDPVFSEYASPFSFAGPKRITAPAVTIEELPRIDVVVISHNHYDHLDTASVQALGNTPLYFVPLGVKAWMVKKGIAAERVEELDWWESRKVMINGVEVDVTATPTQHFSGRGLFDRDKTLWASWAVAWGGFTSWFGGDTGYNDQQFREIGERLPNIDLGIIPVGAYAPQWFMGRIHVNPEEALQIHQDIGARQSLGIHWGTFILTAEEIDEPPRRLAQALKNAGLPLDSFSVFAVGETRRYSQVGDEHRADGHWRDKAGEY